MARPPVVRKESQTTPGGQYTASPSPAAATIVSGPATPSAGAVGQVTNPQRQPEEAPRNVSSPAPPSAGVLDQITGQKRPVDMHSSEHKQSSSATSAMAPSPASTINPTLNNASGFFKPSAGVLDQITGQQHRSTDLVTKPPAPAVPSAGVLDQITGQRQATSGHATPKAPSPLPPSPAVSQQASIPKPLPAPVAGNGPMPSPALVTPDIEPSQQPANIQQLHGGAQNTASISKAVSPNVSTELGSSIEAPVRDHSSTTPSVAVATSQEMPIDTKNSLKSGQSSEKGASIQEQPVNLDTNS
jgi:hypothetical protein